MSRPTALSLSVKLPLMLSLVVVGVALVIGAAMVWQDRSRLNEQLQERARVLAQSIAVTAAEPLLRNDSWSLYKSLRQITLGPDGFRAANIVGAVVLDPEGRVKAHVDPKRHPMDLPYLPAEMSERQRLATVLAHPEAVTRMGSGVAESIVPVVAGGKVIGIVWIELSTADVEAAIRSAALTVLALALGLALAGSIVGGVWSAAALRPLKVLAGSMDALASRRIAPLPVPGGDEIGQLMASFNRMTEELAEKRRLAAELAANEKVIALGRIAAGVAHEVNNPLAGMLNCLNTLRARGNDPQLVARYLPMIETGLLRIGALVKDLLSDLRVEDATRISGPGDLDTIRDLIAAELDGSTIGFVWTNDLRPTDRVNPAKMEQILLNLLRNAIQASPNWGAVSCEMKPVGDELRFEVADEGGGISAEDRPHIFDPFFTRRTNGTGLGLWVVLRLVRSMGGRIDVESAPTRGTVFRVSIPAEVADDASQA